MGSSTKTIVVVGATGNQGCSVTKTFLSLPHWHVRALTRSPTSEKAESLKREAEAAREAHERSVAESRAKASALITRIKGCRSLENAQFEGVIQPDARTGKDQFALRAHLRQEAADAPTPHTP